MAVFRVVLKIVFWVLLIGFGCNFVLQSMSYAFYKRAKPMPPAYEPEPVQYTDSLAGYGYNLERVSGPVVLFFGGSQYTAYNSVGQFGGKFAAVFLAADFYGSGQSRGKMNLKTMQQTALDFYDWAAARYPGRAVVAIGHSYGAGIAAYLASERSCARLVLASAYRSLSDLYNEITPIFWGPAEAFISNDIRLCDYAKNVSCPVEIIGSEADKTLGAALQRKVADCFNAAELMIFEDIAHDGYFGDERVVSYINGLLYIAGI